MATVSPCTSIAAVLCVLSALLASSIGAPELHLRRSWETDNPGFLGCTPTQPATTLLDFGDLGPLYDNDLPEMGVTFESTDKALLALFNKGAEAEATTNRAQFGPLSVMVEGGGYKAVWLETQRW